MVLVLFRGMGKGRDYLTRDELVETIRERFREIEGMADGEDHDRTSRRREVVEDLGRLPPTGPRAAPASAGQGRARRADGGEAGRPPRREEALSGEELQDPEEGEPPRVRREREGREAGAGVGKELPPLRPGPRAREMRGEPVGVTRTCSWCARASAKPLPPIVLEHRRSAIDHTIFLCATCSGPNSTVWRMFTRAAGGGSLA
jgi:hypothetical protein